MKTLGTAASRYLKTLGGFTVAATGGFFGLEACGLDDLAAGNAVLLALCAYGAGLLFFDGGVTQAALESQAIRQLAFEEGEILEQAPRAEIAELRPGAAASANRICEKASVTFLENHSPGGAVYDDRALHGSIATVPTSPPYTS